MTRKIRTALCALTALTFAVPSHADDTGFEVIAIGELSSNQSDYAALSVRMPLIAKDGSDLRVAFEGLRLRFDVSRSGYDTGYDGIDGRGSATTFRGALSYGIALSNSAALTLVGGVSYRETQVRPASPSAPPDASRTGAFAAAELEILLPEYGNVQMLLEHDQTSGSYGAITYLHEIGALRMGPTLTHFSDGNYAQSRAGVVAAFDLLEDVELRMTATRGWASVGGVESDALYTVQGQLRFAF